MRLSQAKYLKGKRYTEKVDINAARNILAAGHAVLACGEMAALGRSEEAGTHRGVLGVRLYPFAFQVTAALAAGARRIT